MLSHVYPSSSKRSNRSNDFPTFVLARHYRSRPKKSSIVTPANVQNGQQKYGKLTVKLAG